MLSGTSTDALKRLPWADHIKAECNSKKSTETMSEENDIDKTLNVRLAIYMDRKILTERTCYTSQTTVEKCINCFDFGE